MVGCSVEGCERQRYIRGWCRAHYMRWRRCGDPRGRRPRACDLPGCGRRHFGLGWCRGHYMRWWRYGDPLARPARKGAGHCRMPDCGRTTHGGGLCLIHWRAARLEYKRAVDQAYYAAHASGIKARTRQWARNHPAAVSRSQKAHLAKVRGAPVADLTAEQWRLIQAAFGYRCAYCGGKPARLTQDHITPVSKGGHHTVSNIVPACAPCNSRKHAGRPLQPVQPLLFVEDMKVGAA